MKLDPRIRAQLARRRIDLGLSQEKVARRLGLWRTRLNQLENGANNPSHELLTRWAAALGYEAEIREVCEVILHECAPRA